MEKFHSTSLHYGLVAIEVWYKCHSQTWIHPRLSLDVQNLHARAKIAPLVYPNPYTT